MQADVPSHETIRVWMQRVGLGRMRKAKRKAGGTWLVDHTNQIGKDKVLVVLRVRSAPRPGVALRHRDVETLAVLPGTEWKREDVAQAYRQLAEQYGTPDTVVSDGAVELREPVECLKKGRKTPRVFRDPKHFLANKLESLLKRDPNWEAFTQKLGKSRSALQQTELAHFTPPPFKMKARFMNLQPTLHWAATVLWHLDHPESPSRDGVSAERMEDKLAWLRDFAASIAQWQACQAAISATLTFLNQQGIFRGVRKEYRRAISGLAHSPASRQLAGEVEALLRQYEKMLPAGQRVRISTEILESGFSRFKQLEQQHSKSGFTSLILAFPTLLRPTTAKEVTACFAKVKVSDLKAWTKERLPTTLASQRQRMFREANPKQRTQSRATPLPQAA